MLKYKLIYFLIAIVNMLVAQTKTVEYKNKLYHAYLGFSNADKVPADSVKALILRSNNFKDFPKEIFKYKNLQYLEIGTYSWGLVLDSLTPKQKKEYEKLKEKACDRCGVNKYYKTNYLYRIPKEINQLKHLEVLDISGAHLKDPCGIYKDYEMLSDIEVIPNKQNFENLFHNDLLKCKN
jgi:Leucine-rich repeat (LRR) protein